MKYEKELRMFNGWLHRSRQADMAFGLGLALVLLSLCLLLFTQDRLGAGATYGAGILAMWLAGAAYKNIDCEIRNRLP